MILVTGANGFIGAHLVEALLGAGERVLGLLEPGDAVRLPAHPGLKWVEADLRDPQAILGLGAVEGVYHLGGIARLQYNRSEADYQAVNVEGTRAVAELAARSAARRLVVVSTIEAAGAARDEVPLRETDAPRPENAYGRSKLAAEQVAFEVGRRTGLPVTAARLPMVYGPGNTLIFSRLFRIAATGWYPRIGRRDVKMEFCNVHNAVHALRLAYRSPRAPGEVFFINDGRSYTIREVVDAVARACGHPAGARFVTVPAWLALAGGALVEQAARLWPRPPLVTALTGKPVFSRATVRWTTRSVNVVSSEKARELLGYVPVVGLAEGVEEAVAWYRSQGLLAPRRFTGPAAPSGR